MATGTGWRARRYRDPEWAARLTSLMMPGIMHQRVERFDRDSSLTSTHVGDIIGAREARFIRGRRVGHLGTTDATPQPHVMPVCFALDGDAIYTLVDAKPKKTTNLKRVRNVAETGRAAVLFDRYDDDWSRLGWVLVRGAASVLHEGREHSRALALLRERYTQYRDMPLEESPVIAVRADSCTSWGSLEMQPDS